MLTPTNKRLRELAGIFLAWCFLPPLCAEEGITSHVLSGGGGTASAGGIAFSATIGQPVAGFSTGGTYQLQSGFWGSQLEVVVDPVAGFEAWMENLPDDQKPPADQRGPQDEPASDGMSNLLKYALGLMPMTPSADSAPVVKFHEGHLVLELGRSPDAEVTFELEGSADLQAWERILFIEELVDSNIGNGRERVRLVSGLTGEEGARYFLRLRVGMP